MATVPFSGVSRLALEQLRGDVLREVGLLKDPGSARWAPNGPERKSQSVGSTQRARPQTACSRSSTERQSSGASCAWEEPTSRTPARPATAIGIRGTPSSPSCPGTRRPVSAVPHSQRICVSRPSSAAANHRAQTPRSLAASIRKTSEAIESTVCLAGERLFERLVHRLNEMDVRSDRLFRHVDRSAVEDAPATANVPAPWGLLAPSSPKQASCGSKATTCENSPQSNAATHQEESSRQTVSDGEEDEVVVLPKRTSMRTSRRSIAIGKDGLPVRLTAHARRSIKHHENNAQYRISEEQEEGAMSRLDEVEETEEPGESTAHSSSSQLESPRRSEGQQSIVNDPQQASAPGELPCSNVPSRDSALKIVVTDERLPTLTENEPVVAAAATAAPSIQLTQSEPQQVPASFRGISTAVEAAASFRRISTCVALPGKPSPLEQHATSSDVSAVCRSRAGQVLRKQSILKCDHFPSGRNKKLPVQLAEAPNFRQVPELPIYGVAQPTVNGVMEVLTAMRESCQTDRILWINCREEPVLYINGRPYACRDRASPYTNLETVGIEPEQLEDMERQLKVEVIEEAAKYGGRILLHGERIPEHDGAVAAIGEMYAYWEPLVETFCMQEVYEQLKSQFPEVQFERLPITDEHAPEEKDFDALIEMITPILTENETVALIFNCQLGRGRTTTGMVLGVLLSHLPTFDKGANFTGCQLHEEEAESHSREGDSKKASLLTHAPRSRLGANQSVVSNSGDRDTTLVNSLGLSRLGDSLDPKTSPRSPSMLGTRPSVFGGRQKRAASILPEVDYGSTDFTVVIEVVNRLSNGSIARKWVDGAIEACNHMVNLRKVLFDKQARMQKADTEKKKSKERKILIDFMERYIYLILFSQYLKSEISLIDESGDASNFPSIAFRDYMQGLHASTAVYELLDDIEQHL